MVGRVLVCPALQPLVALWRLLPRWLLPTGAEAETSQAWAVHFWLSFSQEMKCIHGGGVRLLQGAGKLLLFLRSECFLGMLDCPSPTRYGLGEKSWTLLGF